MSMRCTALANCGLLLECGEDAVLIDAPCGRKTLFDGTDDREFKRILSSEGSYRNLRGLLFTHKHSDHYDSKRVRDLCMARPVLTMFAPNGATPEFSSLRVGVFEISCFSVPHSGEEFSGVYHRVFLIRGKESSVYLTGDASWDHPIHGEILEKYRPSAAFWNPNFLSHEEGRALLRKTQRNFINHMPVESDDSLGIGRKARTCFQRYVQEIGTTVLLTTYPVKFEI